MRKQELDDWIENGGELTDELTEDEKSYLENLGWSIEERWRENGKKWYEISYHHGKKHGKVKWWWDDGSKYIEEYYHHGKRHGDFVRWNRNGQKWEEECHHHGKKHGVFKEWKDDGTLEEHKEYAYGILLKDYLKEETK